MSNSLIQFENVSVIKNNKTILENINFQINPYDFITVIGPNGAGKTTLLKCILGLEQPNNGKIFKTKNLSIGYMPQKLSLSPYLPLSVETFMQINLVNNSNGVIADILDKVGAKYLMNYSLHNLSGGELQRVLLARAILNKPELLILDEPVQGVDIDGQNNLYQLIANLTKEYKCAVFLVSHDLHFVMAKSEQVLCLNKHICCSGHPEVVKISPLYKTLFGRKHHIEENVLAPYHHDHDHKHDDAQDCKMNKCVHDHVERND